VPRKVHGSGVRQAGAQLDLPPPFRPVALREAGDAFAYARIIAIGEGATGEGAGTLVHVGRFDLAEFAVVLEPDEPLRSVRRMFYSGLIALRDALAVHAPPHRPITFVWPDAIQVDGGLIGGARLAWPAASDENEPPEWLVFGAMLRTVAVGENAAGPRPVATALDEDDLSNVGSGELVESCARHLLTAIDAWQANEFGMIARRYLRHLTHEKGGLPAIDDNGDLLVRWPGRQEPDRRSIVEALTEPTWFDQTTGEPRT
jgi:hypothetical protein